MRIHQAKTSDADIIAPLFEQYREFYNQPKNSEGARAFIYERLSKNESIIYYAQNGKKQVLGFVQLYPTFSSTALKRLWILNDLFVVPEARRQSVARKLLEHASEFTKTTDARGLTLKTAVDNVSAQKLYESLNWVRNERFYSYDLINK